MIKVYEIFSDLRKFRKQIWFASLLDELSKISVGSFWMGWHINSKTCAAR